MSDEIEQTDEAPDGAEMPLTDEVSEPQAEEPEIEPQAEEAVEAEAEPESDHDALEEIAESLSGEPEAAEAAEAEPQDTAEADTVVESEIEPQETAEPSADSEAAVEPATASDLADVVVSPELVPEKLRSPIPWWPFWALTFVWIALCGAAAYFLTRDPSMPSLRQEAYTFVVAAGLALTVLGPLLAIVVWAFSRRGVPAERRPGMFVTSLLRAAVITFLGVVAWTGTLIFVDALRLGLIRF